MSVPTNEVRNNLDRNPGLRSPLGLAPPFDIALLSMHSPQSQYVRTSYAWIRSVGRKSHQDILPKEKGRLEPNTWKKIDDFLQARFDWCCFYYFLRNSSVALLEALFARIFLDLRYQCADFFWFFFARPVSYKTPCSASPGQAPVPGCHHSSCVLIIHVCLCVRASICACENVQVKWQIFSKNKQDRDDVTCSIMIENRNRCS